jgi:hypothetical protein
VYGSVERAEYDEDAKDVAEVQNLKHGHVTTASVDLRLPPRQWPGTIIFPPRPRDNAKLSTKISTLEIAITVKFYGPG